MPTDLHALVAPSIAAFPDRTALTTPDGQAVSYARLDATLDAFAAAATKFGLKAGDIVTLEIDNFAVQVCLVIALSRLGVTTVLGATTDGALNAGLSLAAAITLDPRQQPQPKNLRFTQDWFTPPGKALPATPGFAHDTDTALIVTSSGTTGRRKYMPLSMAQIKARLPLFDPLYGTGHPNKMITIGAMTQYGFMLILRTLNHGGMVMQPGNSPRRTLELLSAHGVDELCTSPNIVMDLVRDQHNNPVPLPALKQIVVGGSGMSAKAMTEVQMHLCRRVLISYGATEVGPIAVASSDELAGQPAGTVGHVRPGAEVVALNNSGAPLPPGQTGQLRIRVAPELRIDHYLYAGAEGEASLQDGWFYPGDDGHIGKDNMLVITGRRSEVINIGGNKLSPDNVAAIATGINGVLQAAAVGISNAAGYEDVCVAMVCDGTLSTDAMREALTNKLGRNTPLRVRIVERLPHNAGGKLDRDTLRSLFSEPTPAPR